MMDLVRERGLLGRKGSDVDMKQWKKVKVFEDLTQESSITFDEPYTELIIISENVKGKEDGSQLIKYINDTGYVNGQNGDLKSTVGYNCVDFIECIADGYIRNTHLQRQQYPITGLNNAFVGLFNISSAEMTSLRLTPQYGNFLSGKATIYAR